MSSILEIKKLRGGYVKGVDILQGVDLAIEQGEAVGIIGLNGCGKSTLGKAVMNMIPRREGTIAFNGEDISSLPTHLISRKGISIMQQGGQVFQTLSVWDNLRIAVGQDIERKIDELKEIIPLLSESKQQLQGRMADKLSGGQRHQLALAMALATKPELLILDEPSAGLSPKSVDQMYQMLSDAKERYGLSILLIEQNIARAVEFCGRTLLISRGYITDSLSNQFDNLIF